MINQTSREAKHVCMLAFTDYETDGRIIRYANTLAEQGDIVDVVACSTTRNDPGFSKVDQVNLHRIYHRKKNEGGPISFLIPLLAFFFRSLVFISRKHIRHRYDLIHVHNIPEWLVFAAALPKLFGARIILDIHDIVPELYSAKFNPGKTRNVLETILKTVEKASCRFADHVIISNHLWREKLVRRSVKPEKCSVFVNNIDLDLFSIHVRRRSDDTPVILFPGSLHWHQGVDLVIRAFPAVLKQIPNAQFHIYGTGGMKRELKNLVAEHDLSENIHFFDPVPVRKIPQIMANADAGVVPKRADSFGNEAYSTKIMEFMSQGVPVVQSRTAIDTYYFDDKEVRFFEPEDTDDLANRIVEVLTDQSLRKEMIQRSYQYVEKNHWGARKSDYLEIVDLLVAAPRKRNQSTTRKSGGPFQ